MRQVKPYSQEHMWASIGIQDSQYIGELPKKQVVPTQDCSETLDRCQIVSSFGEPIAATHLHQRLSLALWVAQD